MRHRLGCADVDDASQNVWLTLADQLGHFRDPAALAGWPSRNAVSPYFPRPELRRTAPVSDAKVKRIAPT
jgi:hypothetical protein